MTSLKPNESTNGSQSLNRSRPTNDTKRTFRTRDEVNKEYSEVDGKGDGYHYRLLNLIVNSFFRSYRLFV